MNLNVESAGLLKRHIGYEENLINFSLSVRMRDKRERERERERESEREKEWESARDLESIMDDTIFATIQRKMLVLS